MSDNTVEKFHRRHARSILREFVNRVVDQCDEQGRGDLSEGLYLLERLVLENPQLVRAARIHLLGILRADTVIQELTDEFMEDQKRQREAAFERIGATIQ